MTPSGSSNGSDTTGDVSVAVGGVKGSETLGLGAEAGDTGLGSAAACKVASEKLDLDESLFDGRRTSSTLPGFWSWTRVTTAGTAELTDMPDTAEVADPIVPVDRRR